MVYYNPYISGQYNPLYNQTNQGFFIAQLPKNIGRLHLFQVVEFTGLLKQNYEFE